MDPPDNIQHKQHSKTFRPTPPHRHSHGPPQEGRRPDERVAPLVHQLLPKVLRQHDAHQAPVRRAAQDRRHEQPARHRNSVRNDRERVERGEEEEQRSGGVFQRGVGRKQVTDRVVVRGEEEGRQRVVLAGFGRAVKVDEVSEVAATAGARDLGMGRRVGARFAVAEQSEAEADEGGQEGHDARLGDLVALAAGGQSLQENGGGGAIILVY